MSACCHKNVFHTIPPLNHFLIIFILLYHNPNNKTNQRGLQYLSRNSAYLTRKGVIGYNKARKLGGKMKKTYNFYALIALIAIAGLLSGCAGCQMWLNSVNISTSGNLTTVLAGGTLNFRASGQNIMWAVSSSSSGSGPVANGTYISSSGLLTVAYDETALVLYVIATSANDGQSDMRAIRVVTVNAVNITPDNQTVVAGRTSQFRAQVTGNNNPDSAVTWRVSSNPTGTGAVTQGTSINANGVLTVSVNETLRTLYIVATSIVDPTKSGTVSANVVVPTVTQVTVNASSQTAKVGTTLQFRATVTGTYEPASTVTWRVSSNPTGTGAVTPGTSINANGLLTVAANESLRTLYIVATSTVDTTKSGSISVSVVVPTVTQVTVNPLSQTARAGTTLQFSATVTGTYEPATTVTWRVSSNAAGTGAVTPGTSINANGLLTIANNESLPILYIIATSTVDATKSGSASVSIIVPIVNSVTVSPANQTVQAGGSFQFTASVAGTNNPDTSVIWRVSSNAAGTGAVTSGTVINANGLLTVAATESASILYVFATSVFNPGVSGSVIINVTPATASPPGNNPPNNQPGNRPGNNPPNNQPGNNPPNNQPGNRPGNNPPNNQPNQPENNPPNNETPTTPPVTTPTVTSVAISPSSYSTRTNTTVQFSATVTGTNYSGNSVTWRVSPNADGTGEMAPRTTISANGLLTVAPNEWATHLYVFAISTVDPTKFSMAVVTITNNNSNQGSNQGR
jgi:hypothetical protein